MLRQGNDETILDREYAAPSLGSFSDCDGPIVVKSEWDIIDSLIEVYQKSCDEGINDYKEDGDRAATLLLEKFSPVFKKYIALLKTGQINFNDCEQKQFVALFIDEVKLRKALYSKNPLNYKQREIISYKFGFIKETYGNLDEEEILTDIYVVFFILARRYKKTNRSFCCYLYNAFKYEMFRHIKCFTNNPANIYYKNISYEEVTIDGDLQLVNEYDKIPDIESDLSTDDNGQLTSSWVAGLACSEVFMELTPLERKILEMYYVRNMSARQIAETFHIHTNTCNKRRHEAIKKLADRLGIDPKSAVRTRNTSKK